MTRHKFIVLFDIDGTLVSGPNGGTSAGLRAMNRAAELLTGNSDLGNPREFAGRTDPQIARMLLVEGGISEPAPALIEQLLEHYLQLLEENSTRTPYIPLGHPARAVESVVKHGGLVGLGTGNLRRGAAIKLRSAAILDLFDLDCGGYGNDGAERFEVLRVGIERTSPRTANSTEPELPVIVVGDTPHDVTAAHAVGAHCIGVPFGANTRDSLLATGCDLVLDQVDENLGGIVAERFL